ncbi:MAG: hypothetical protein HRU26_05450, partial [Psychroserpens sp.]|nr:hypothetical protein [Psychroserpens sp.]
ELSNIINKDTWIAGDYKFSKETVLLNYVVGNLKFYTDENGRRVKYYQMEAGISFYSKGWGIGEGKISVRSQGSFYYSDLADSIKRPRDRNGSQKFDLDAFGGLKSQDINDPTVDNPDRDEFRIYELKKFNFVDR